MPTTAAGAAANITKVLRAGRAGLPRDADEIGTLIVNDLTVTLSKPGKGRLYTTWFFTNRQGNVVPWGTRPPHRASAPGDPPAVDTGRLRSSWGFQSRRTATGADVTIATGDKKAALLEFGTSKMKPRPSIRPVMLRNRTAITRIVARNVEARQRAMARRLT